MTLQDLLQECTVSKNKRILYAPSTIDSIRQVTEQADLLVPTTIRFICFTGRTKVILSKAQLLLLSKRKQRASQDR